MATGLSPLIITCYCLELSVDCDSLLPPPWVRWAHHAGDYQSTGHDCVHAACCRYYAINFRSYTRHLHLLQWNNIWGMLTKQSFDWLPSLSLNLVTRSVPWIACAYTGHTFSLEGNKYVIPSSSNHLPVVILVIYIYFNCEKKIIFGCNKCYQHWSDMCSATACVQQLSQPYSLYYFYRTVIGVFKTLSSG